MKATSIHTQMRHEMADKTLFEQAKAYAFDYMDTTAARRVYPDQKALHNLSIFDEPMLEIPSSGEDVLRLLHEYGSPATVAQTGGRYYGFVNGNVIPAALAARWLADTWDQNPALYVISPIVAKLEQICEQWLTALFALPRDTVAGFVSGIVLCRHKDALIQAMQASGSYIQYSEERDGMLYGPDMSRRARAVEVWAVLKYLGRRGVAQLIDGFCERASRFAEGLKNAGFTILNDVVFNQVLVAGQTPLETQGTLTAIQQAGVCWCGGTVWEDRPAIRISVCSWATTTEDIDASVRAFVEAREIASGNGQPV